MKIPPSHPARPPSERMSQVFGTMQKESQLFDEKKRCQELPDIKGRTWVMDQFLSAFFFFFAHSLFVSCFFRQAVSRYTIIYWSTLNVPPFSFFFFVFIFHFFLRFKVLDYLTKSSSARTVYYTCVKQGFRGEGGSVDAILSSSFQHMRLRWSGGKGEKTRKKKLVNKT